MEKILKTQFRVTTPPKENLYCMYTYNKFWMSYCSIKCKKKVKSKFGFFLTESNGWLLNYLYSYHLEIGERVASSTNVLC